jgi:DNA-binding transcriptional ArsR family regulator
MTYADRRIYGRTYRPDALALSNDDFHRIAQLGAIMADETRLRLLLLLLETPATTSELVARLGVVQPRVSAHLAALRRTGLVSLWVAGRQHVYAIKSDRVANAIRSFLRLASLSSSSLPSESVGISRTALREVGRDSPIRRARTCYDHLAGVAGVELLDEILRRGWVEEGKVSAENRRTVFILTDKGRKALQRLNVQLAEARGSKRMFAYGCLDWTERRYHLGGFLGKAVLQSLLAERIVEKMGQRNNSRAVAIRKPIVQWFVAHQGPSN